MGATEILTTSVESGRSYRLIINYQNSVLALHSSFKECPHIVFEISIISLKDLSELESELGSELSDKSKKQNDIRQIYKRLSSMETTLLADPS